MSETPKPPLPSGDTLVRMVGKEALGAHKTAQLIVEMLTDPEKSDAPSVTEQIVELLERVIEGQRQQFLLLDSIASDVLALKQGRVQKSPNGSKH